MRKALHGTPVSKVSLYIHGSNFFFQNRVIRTKLRTSLYKFPICNRFALLCFDRALAVRTQRSLFAPLMPYVNKAELCLSLAPLIQSSAFSLFCTRFAHALLLCVCKIIVKNSNKDAITKEFVLLSTKKKHTCCTVRPFGTAARPASPIYHFSESQK